MAHRNGSCGVEHMSVRAVPALRFAADPDRPLPAWVDVSAARFFAFEADGHT